MSYATVRCAICDEPYVRCGKSKGVQLPRHPWTPRPEEATK